jgi:hypothetical protein
MTPALRYRHGPTRSRPRKTGRRAALGIMEAEDQLVRVLCPGDTVSPQAAAAAAAHARWCILGSSEVHANDLAWLDDAERLITSPPDQNTMTRLEEITSAIPIDAAAVASLNAARWIVRRYEITKGDVQLH